jgi:hypothetical protein
LDAEEIWFVGDREGGGTDAKSKVQQPSSKEASITKFQPDEAEVVAKSLKVFIEWEKIFVIKAVKNRFLLIIMIGVAGFFKTSPRSSNLITRWLVPG